MQAGSTDYYVQVTNKAKSVFFKNKCNYFKVKLQSPLDLRNGIWKVALTKIIYPHSWLNIKQSKSTVTVIHRNVPNVTSRSETISKDLEAVVSVALNPLYGYKDMSYWIFTKIKLEDGYYSTGGELAAQIVHSFKFERSDSDLEKLRFVYQYENSSRSIRFYDATALIFEDADDFVRALGLENGMQCKQVKCSSIVQIFGEKGCLTAYGKSNMPRLDAIYAYSSVVEFNSVGDDTVPLLTVIPVEGEHGHTVAYAPLKPEYKPVAQNYINDIDIQLCTNKGKLIDFDDGEEVTVTLHFKKSGIDI